MEWNVITFSQSLLMGTMDFCKNKKNKVISSSPSVHENPQTGWLAMHPIKYALIVDTEVFKVKLVENSDECLLLNIESSNSVTFQCDNNRDMSKIMKHRI